MVLIAVLALGAMVRVYGLGEPDFWLDELHSQTNSAGRRAEFEAQAPGVIFSFSSGTTRLTSQSTWPAVWRGMSVDSHPPIYFLVLNSWRRAVGDGQYAVRLLAVIFSVLSLIPVALVLREFGRAGAGVATALMLAISYGHIRFAQENRPYSLAILWVSLSYWLFVKLFVGWDGMSKRARRGWAAAYVLVTVAAVMTHYFTAIAMLGQGVVVVTGGRVAFRRVWVVLVVVAVAIFGVIWGPTLLEQWRFIANQPWLQQAEPDHSLRTVLRLTALPVRLLVWHELYMPGYLSSLLGVSVLGVVLRGVGRRTSTAEKLFAMWYLCPVLFFFVVDALTGRQLLQHLRYSSIAVPGLLGLIVLAVWRLRTPARGVVLGLVAAVLILTLHLPAPVNPRAVRTAGRIMEQWRPGDLIVFEALGCLDWALHSYQSVRYFLPSPNELRADVLVLEELADEPLRAAIAEHPRLIVVSPRVGDDVNPLPGTFRETNKTGYLRGIGEIHLFERLEPGEQR